MSLNCEVIAVTGAYLDQVKALIDEGSKVSICTHRCMESAIPPRWVWLSAKGRVIIDGRKGLI